MPTCGWIRTCDGSHYAGSVSYTVEEFVSKNNDLLFRCVARHPDFCRPSAGVPTAAARWVQGHGCSHAAEPQPGAGRVLFCGRTQLQASPAHRSYAGRAGDWAVASLAQWDPTAVWAVQFRTSMNELMATLMAKQPSYVRCIKPNDKKMRRVWDATLVKHQVASWGVGGWVISAGLENHPW